MSSREEMQELAINNPSDAQLIRLIVHYNLFLSQLISDYCRTCEKDLAEKSPFTDTSASIIYNKLGAPIFSSKATYNILSTIAFTALCEVAETQYKQWEHVETMLAQGTAGDVESYVNNLPPAIESLIVYKKPVVSIKKDSPILYLRNKTDKELSYVDIMLLYAYNAGLANTNNVKEESSIIGRAWESLHHHTTTYTHAHIAKKLCTTRTGFYFSSRICENFDTSLPSLIKHVDDKDVPFLTAIRLMGVSDSREMGNIHNIDGSAISKDGNVVLKDLIDLALERDDSI